jgi:hypothetical protein
MFATALILLQLIWSGSELTAPDIAQGRDLSVYDAGGHLDCTRTAHPELFGRVQCIAEARSFIWDHWRQRRRGYVRLSQASVDAQATAHIFIEPDSDGVWRIAWRMSRSGIHREPELADLPDTYRLTRIKADAPEDGTLVLRGADGTEITRL